MKNRIISIAIAIAMCFTCAFVLPATSQTDACYAKSKTKYVKIKKTTYNKMKKTITNQSNAIASYQQTVEKQKATIQNQSKAIQNQSTAIDGYKETIKEKKSTISWLWSTLEDFGYFYNYDTHKWEEESADADEEDQTPTVDSVDMQEDGSQVEIIKQETGLTIDCVQVFESYNDWYAYYVYADGDIYVITVKNGHVDVCTQLN